jgi:signal transduction histidine kinase
MTEEEYQSAVTRKGVHSFVALLSTSSMSLATRQDRWLRIVISVLAGLSAAGLALAWRSVHRSTELEVRLARAAELNARLKEMNLAAAGLAHETRNPLNIIRGLAQLIGRQQDASPEIRSKCRDIVDEADRLTGQLNEFINYSRPREVRRSVVPLQTVVDEVIRALSTDFEDKDIQLDVAADLPPIHADEQLLRQALFNLLLNAVQAVSRGGQIWVTAAKTAPEELRIDIRDDGIGVPPDQRSEIFKPYFTTHPEGTGLGLAIVQQIVLAHGWEITCLANEPRGAQFQIRHIRLANAT